MKRICPFLCCLVAFAGFVSSCDRFTFLPDQKLRVPLQDFDVGVQHKSSLLDKALKKDQDYFSGFTTSEMFDLIEAAQPDKDITEGMTLIKRNKVEFSTDSDKSIFLIQTKPQKDVEILDVIAVSSDTSVLQIVGATPEAIQVSMKKLGDTDLSVRLITEEEDITHVYPLRLVGTVDLKFRISPYWRRHSTTKIRMNIKGIPEGSDDLVMLTKDSVTIHAYCEWYDFVNSGHQPHVDRYVVALPRHDKWVRYKRNTLHLIRDISKEIRDICSQYVEGTMIKETTVTEADGTKKTTIDTVSHKYYYYPENVELDVLIVCDNPFVEFKVRVNCKKTNDTLQEIYVEWEEDPDDIGDQVVDPSLEEEDDQEPDIEWQRESEQYFTVRLNDFLTQAQRDSLLRVVDEKKRQYGYTAELSEEQKDKAMEEINREFEENDGEGQDNENKEVQ